MFTLENYKMSSMKKSIKLSSPATMEGTTITLPKIQNWDVRIGHLWNCRSSSQVAGNIFVQDRIEKEEFLEVVPVHDMKYTLSRVGDSNGKSELLDVSVYVKLELPGAITVEGGVSFTKVFDFLITCLYFCNKNYLYQCINLYQDDQQSSEQEEFYCQYNVQTCVLRTRASIFDPLNADRIFNSKTLEDVYKGIELK
jgi:hypothetical protein